MGTLNPVTRHKRSVSILKQARKHHLANIKAEPSNQAPSSKSWMGLVKSIFSCKLPLHPLAHLKRLHLRLDSSFGKMSQLGVCLQVPCSQPITMSTSSHHTHCRLNFVPFSLETSEKVISGLTSSSAMIPNDISVHVLNSCSVAFTSPLSALLLFQPGSQQILFLYTRRVQ